MYQKILTYILLFWIGASCCFPFQDSEELTKLPMLVHHYLAHHRNESPLGFLIAHYGNIQHKHNDEEGSAEHSKLPMKVHQHEGLQIFQFIPVLDACDLTYNCAISESLSDPFFVMGTPFHRAYTCFHPPRNILL